MNTTSEIPFVINDMMPIACVVKVLNLFVTKLSKDIFTIAGSGSDMTVYAWIVVPSVGLRESMLVVFIVL